MRSSTSTFRALAAGLALFASVAGCGKKSEAPANGGAADAGNAPTVEKKTEQAPRGTPASATPQPSQADRLAATKLLQSGRLAYEKYKYDSALKDLTESIRLCDQYHHAFYYRGQVREAKRLNDDAIADYTEAIRLKSNYLNAYLARGRVLRQKCRYDEAIRDYVEVIRLNPAEFDIYYERAEFFAAIDEPDKAIADYSEVIRRFPRRAGRAFRLRGLIYEQRGDFAEALEDFTRAHRILPKEERDMDNMARVLSIAPDANIRDGKRAVELAKKASESFRGNKAGYFDTLAAAYAETGDFKNAVKWQQKALELCRDSDRKNFRQRMKLYKAGKPYRKVDDEHDKAIKETMAAIRNNPKDADAYYRRGHAWLEKYEAEKALRNFNFAIALNPMMTAAYNGRGNAHRSIEMYTEAFNDYNKAIDLEPKNSSSLYDRGVCHRAVNAIDKSIADLTAAIRIKATDADAFYQRGQSWSQKGDTAKAIKDFNEALRLKETHYEARGSLAWLLATAGDAKLRDGKRAVALATKNCESTDWEDHNDLDTLAAAYAETSDFKNAIQWEKKAIELATISDRDTYRDRLKEYEAGKPHRE